MEYTEIMDKKVTVSPSVVFTDLDDGSAVLLHLDSKFYYSLNETGTFIWLSFEKDPALAVVEVVERLCERYNVDQMAAKTDVTDFLNGLTKEGLVEVR